MKHNLRLLTIILMLAAWNTQAQTTTVFSYTGTVQTFTVPPGATSINVDVAGAAGGSSSSAWVGGCGGRVQATVTVTPGQVLNIYVGSMGGDAGTGGGGAGGNTGPSVSGGDGGGSTYYYYYYYGSGGGGGGGESDIRIGGTALSNRVVAAGGGGGGGIDCAFSSNDGGNGGPAIAGNGLACGAYNPAICGAGGTSVGGGLGGGGGTGGVLLGGTGTTGTVFTYYYYYYYFTSTAGGGGGGGYYGGGGASGGGGGGGSSWTDPVLTSAVTSTGGFCTPTGDGWVKITVPCIPPVSGVILGSPVLCVGSIITYTDPTGTPGGTWSSSNLGVATVNPLTGALHGLSPGITTLTYSISLPCGTATTSSVITVVNAPTAIFGNKSVCIGSPIADTLFDTTGGGTWSSGTPAVGTIDPVTGVITTFSPGTTLITYTAGSCTATATLTVNPLPSAIVGPTAVCRFSTVTLTDPGSPGGTWSSTVPLAASVNPLTGVVTGVGPGGSATNILYTLPTGCSIAHFMSVTTPPLPIVGPGKVCATNAIILTELVGGGTWATSFPAVASVTSGVVTGLSAGVDTISYTMPSCPPVTHIVTVNPQPSAIYGPTAVCLGMATTLIDTTAGGSWSSLNPLITVTPGGVVTTLDTGVSGTIVYTLPTTCFVTITVNTASSPLAIAGPSSVCQGQNVTLTDGTPGGVWSSTDLAIARIVDTSGVDSGISAGLVNISYTMPSGCFAEMPFVVNPPVIPGVVISSPATLICAGTPDTFIATPVNGGLPTYQWSRFSVPVPGATSSTFSYTPIHGDVVNLVMIASGVCALNDTATDSFVVNVYPTDMAPGITIMTGNADTIAYVGEVVTFFSSVIWGGTSPTYQWYMNRVAIPGATASSYTTPVYESDTFYCLVYGNPPCESSTPLPGISNPIIIHDYLGVNPLTVNGNTFALFPNPNNGSFTLSGTLANATNSEVNYQVIDMLGQVVYSGQTTPQNGKIRAQITLSDLASGSYMLRVNTDNTSETFHFVIGK